MQPKSWNLKLPDIYSFDLGLVILKLQSQIPEIKNFYKDRSFDVEKQCPYPWQKKAPNGRFCYDNLRKGVS